MRQTGASEHVQSYFTNLKSNNMTRILGLAAMILIVALSACKEPTTLDPQTVDLTAEEDYATMEYLVNTMEEYIDETVETRDPSADCPEITFARPRGQFPNEITFDFGDGCAGPHGHILSGRIVVNQSAPMKDPGAVRVVTYHNFSIDGVVVVGTKTIENTGTDEASGISLLRSVNLEIVFPNGETASWEGEQQIVQVEGIGTSPRFDDVFEIMGSLSGVNRHGHPFSVTILEPLIRKALCRWLTDGVVSTEVSTSEGIKTRSIDFGHPNDGECDPLALVILADGTQKEIHIHRKWW